MVDILIIIGFVILFGGIIWYQKFYKKSLKVLPPEFLALRLTKTHTTPMGAEVRAESGVVINEATLQAIDRGIMTNIARVERLKPQYLKKFSPSEFIVAVLKAELTPGNLPVFRVPISKSDPYYKTDYNKGTPENPYVWAAGQMIAAGNPDGNVLAVPAPITNDFDYLASGVDYECEHIQAAWNDGDLFEATKSHIGEGHPIYKEMVGFAGSVKSYFPCANCA